MNYLPHRSLGDYVELARLLRLHPPDGAQIIRPADLVVVRYVPGRLTDEQFSAIAGALEFEFPDLKFIVIEADEIELQPDRRVIRGSSPPEER